MSLGFRRRLLLLSLVFITVVDLGVGLYLESRLHESLMGRYEDELVRHNRAMVEALEGQAAGLRDAALVRSELDPLADRFGAAMEVRVSVVGPGGDLLADSELPQDQLEVAGDHGDRPEVIEARQGGQGIARRHSATLDANMLYVAERLEDGSGRVVRVSVPLSQIDESVRQLRWILLLAGLAALGAAALLAMAASRLLSRSLRDLVVTAQHEAGAIRDDSHDDEDQPLSVNALADDLRRTVRLLGTERERFETVLETMGQAVIGLDAEQRFTTVNRAARSLLELPETVEGRPLLDFVRVPALRELVDRVAGGSAASSEFDYGMSPRRRIQAHATASRHGGGTVIVMHDVTELRRLETVRKDFIANVSHELRTPVAVIQANAETLLAGAIHDTERAPVFLEALARHADRLGRLVADLLDISRIEAGRYQLEIGPMDLVEVVDRTLAGLAMQAEQRGTTLVSRLQGELWVASDDKALEQVLVNLVSNAIKYTQDGGHVEVDAKVVERTASGEPARLRVEVCDDGPGIDPRHHQRVFERFYRVDSGRAREMGGTGLGLAIVKHLIEAMGGRVGVDARRPRGSIFWFTMSTAVAAFGEGPEDEDELGGDEASSV
ncbi:MAG: PAS domain-containing protein [Myxococcales bacterium]|nr:PAS domain-containing protein [Myxococcales bacterium]MCB9714126.1 PAS domain-containing protein [Myxococcales bacterium]